MKRLLKPLADVLPDGASVAYLLGYVRADWLRVALLVSGSAAQSLLLLPTLWLTKFAIDHAIPEKDTRLLLLTGAGLVGLRVVAAIAGLVLRWDTLKIVKHVVARIRMDLLARIYLLRSDAAAIADGNATYSRIVTDTERLDRMCGTLLSVTLPAVLAVTFLLVYLAHWNVLLLGFAALVAALVWLLNRLTTRRALKRVEHYHQSFEHFGRGVRFLLHHRLMTRSRAAEDFELARQRQAIDVVESSGLRMGMGYAVQNQLRGLTVGVVGGVVIIGGGLAIINGLMSFGALMALYLAAGMLGSHGGRIADTLPDIMEGGVALQKLHRLAIAGPTDPYTGSEPVGDWKRIAVEDVDFSYGEAKVLAGVLLAIDRQSNILVIGRNGAGKTTLLQVLLGFERPQHGRVTVDGVPYDRLDLASLRATIGLVPQHPDFFAGTVRDNLLYGLAPIPDAELDVVVRLAEAHFIHRLPQGYDSEVGEGGRLLSGGERQLLAIARALLMRPRLLVLDEPTNHLDVETIERLMRGLSAAPGRPALFAISHDPAVAAFADEIFELEASVLTPRSPPVDALRRIALP